MARCLSTILSSSPVAYSIIVFYSPKKYMYNVNLWKVEVNEHTQLNYVFSRPY